MLDIRLFRAEQGGNPELVRESQRRRFADVKLVDRVIELDERWRQAQFRVDALRRELNESSKRVSGLIKSGADASELISSVADLKRSIPAAEREAAALEQERDALLREIGNLVHESVPVSVDEADNRVERLWGYPELADERVKNAHRSHIELLLALGAADYERGARVAGSRGYFLIGPGVRLNLALVQYALNFLRERGFREMQPPYFMTSDAMARCAQLSDFDEQLYKVTVRSRGAAAGEPESSGTGGTNATAAAAEDDKYYLIATSEQPICAYHTDEWLDPSTLPLLYAGFSTCFRKEAGAHGRDQLGIFRVHQFEKIEQFVSIVSGALNNAASKKYDLEGWYPASKAWRELVSCSNCTDYQSRRLLTRYGMKKGGDREKRFVHMLNSTLCATTRVICCIVENYQRENGVEVPAVLQPYLGGETLLPFVNLPQKGSLADQSG
jgi:seryl-tRNA synthetase